MQTSEKDIIDALEAALVKGAGGLKRLQQEIPLMIRRALDEVIDTPRTSRTKLDQIEKTEKTYIGTKIEILFRSLVGFPKGLLDLEVNGIDVDIKNTVSGNWMIPQEAVGKPCVLISSDEATALCSVGLLVCLEEHLTSGKNRDGKKSISAKGKERIRWLLKDAPYPRNFWEDISPKEVNHIMKASSGSERLTRLFEMLIGTPISRKIVLGVGRQDDSMKRLRKNGGARDRLLTKGVALLSGKYDSPLIAKLKLPFCACDEFISYKPTSPEEADLLKRAGHL